MAQENRIWRKGPPPHVGWWNASLIKDPHTWRWWNGTSWSFSAYPDNDQKEVGYQASRVMPGNSDIKWTDYWPENARVPRINPESL